MLRKIQGCLAGVAIGDAMGMPVEMMTARDIRETIGRVEDYLIPAQRRIDEGKALEKGSTTDDWQLTRVVCESLISCGKFDIMDQALRHVGAMEESVSGWGRTTREGLEQIKLYFDSRGKDGRSPWEKRNGEGCGNGVAMKAAPMGIYNRLLDRGMPALKTDLRSEMHTLGQLTHPDVRAWEAGVLIAHLVDNLLKENMEDFDYRQFLYDYSQFIFYLKSVERRENLKGDLLSGRLEVLNPDLLKGPIENLIGMVGNGCYALESVVFAVGILLRHYKGKDTGEKDFRGAILEAVNAGGDADSNASMVGAMMGAAVGIDHIPEEWLWIPSVQEAMNLGESLYLRFNR